MRNSLLISFSSLTSLNASGNNLTIVDLSGNTPLKEIVPVNNMAFAAVVEEAFAGSVFEHAILSEKTESIGTLCEE